MKTCNNELLMEMRKIVYYSSESHLCRDCGSPQACWSCSEKPAQIHSLRARPRPSNLLIEEHIRS
jgi:hypothetical protein